MGGYNSIELLRRSIATRTLFTTSFRRGFSRNSSYESRRGNLLVTERGETPRVVAPIAEIAWRNVLKVRGGQLVERGESGSKCKKKYRDYDRANA